MLLYTGGLLAMVLALVTLAVVLGVPFTDWQGVYLYEQGEAARHLSVVADLKKERFLLWLEQRKGNLRALSQNGVVERSLKGLPAEIRDRQARGEDPNALWAAVAAGPDYEALQQRLGVVMGSYGMFERIRVVDPELGIIIASTDGVGLGRDVTGRPWFSLPLARPNDEWVRVLRDPLVGRPYMTIATAVCDFELARAGHNKVIGILVAYIDTDEFIKPMLYTGGGLGATGEIVLVDGDRRILMSLAHPLADGSMAVELEQQVPTKPAGLATMGKEGLIGAEDYRGVGVLAAYRHLPIDPDQDWGMVVKRDEAEVLVSVRQVVAWAVVVGGAGLLVGLVLLLGIVTRVAAPIQALSRAALEAQGGDLSVRATVHRRDEVGRLAGSFNAMIERIQGSQRALETRVKERTSQLQGANERLAREIAEHKQTEEERGKMERQFVQAQKMEAVGQLAGGIAHDFRNQLTVIKGYGEILLRHGQIGEEDRQSVLEILKAADRSAAVSADLLSFSRKQSLRPEVVAPGDLVEEIVKSLRQAIPENIELSAVRSGGPGHIMVDPGQLRHALTNLAINARDAMPGGGRITIETSNALLDQAYAASHVDVIPGAYVMMSVSDSGEGMAPATLAKVFDPFFTTKPVGKGTGLGLAMVYGFARQSGGHVAVYSEPGQGTVFRLYFPRVDADAGPGQADQVLASPLPRGVGTVLVVEDDPAIRRLIQQTLEGCGYTVVAAAGPEQALSIACQGGLRVDLLLTDVVMPGLDGFELARRIVERDPATQVLHMSGHAADAIAKRGPTPVNAPILTKPFSTRALAEAVRDALRGTPKADN